MTAKVIDRDLGAEAFFRSMRELKGAYAKVGILSDDARGGLHQRKPDGTAEDLTIAEIAVVNEFGTEDGHIPARSFVRSTYDKMRERLTADAAKLAGSIVDGKMDLTRALNILGAELATGIRAAVTQGAGIPPPNAPSTLARKEAKGAWNSRGAAQAQGLGPRPLVDTGAMVNAVTWAVVIDEHEGPHNYVAGGG